MPKKRVNSNLKGSAGEREAAKYLRSLGFSDARRTQQYCGTEGTSDVVCPESLPDTHIEVKYGYPKSSFDVDSYLFRGACYQAQSDSSDGENWVVLWRPKGSRKWRVTYQLGCAYPTISGDHVIPLVLNYVQQRAATRLSEARSIPCEESQGAMEAGS